MAREPLSENLEKLSLNPNGLSTKKSPLVVSFGELLIDFVPTVSGVSLAEAPAFKKAPGGAPANVAVCVARLGGSSAFIGKVGEDEFGHMLADVLEKNKVDISGMRFDRSARTALAFVTLRADGEREFMFFRNPSADMLLQESELDIGLIKKATIFHYGSISLIEEPCRSAQLAAMSIVKESGGLLSYDPNLRLALWPSADAARKGIMSIWDRADIIKISEEEITFLTGGDDPYNDDVVLKKLFHPNLTLLLVSEGSQGCRYYTKQFKGKVPGLKVKPIDTTGAGDAFIGGLLSRLSTYLNLYQVWFLGENTNYAVSEYAWESATPPGTALMMLDADKMVAAASSRNPPTLASALTRLQRCAFSGSWEKLHPCKCMGCESWR